MVTLVAALLSILFIPYFSRRLPKAKLFFPALLSILVHILSAGWLWRSWWRRCCRPSCLV
jgi:hypothetical protein